MSYYLYKDSVYECLDINTGHFVLVFGNDSIGHITSNRETFQISDLSVIYEEEMELLYKKWSDSVK